MKRAKTPRTHQIISVLKRQLYKTDWKVEKLWRIDQNRWKIALRNRSTGREKQIFIDKRDTRSLRRFKAEVRKQV